jgi:hypothetical protein
MAEPISLWCGFSTAVYRKVVEGEGMTITLTGRAEPRITPEEAWQDALRQELMHDQSLKKENIRPSAIVTGIAPAQYVP